MIWFGLLLFNSVVLHCSIVFGVSLSVYWLSSICYLFGLLLPLLFRCLALVGSLAGLLCVLLLCLRFVSFGLVVCYCDCFGLFVFAFVVGSFACLFGAFVVRV